MMADPREGAGPGARLVCRCEEVADEAIAAAVAEGARTINDVKRRTRAGMGLCQGIYCAGEIAAELARLTGQQPAAILPMTARPPARPLPLGLLAGVAPAQDV